MKIDQLLARFRIQTKVLIFIVPFIVSIVAVGITGLYATGTLRGRMTVSNNIVQSLSGFKEVSAAMTAFLANATVERRDLVAEKLNEQIAVLSNTMSDLKPGAAGRDMIEASYETSQDIAESIKQLWSEQERKTVVVAQLRTQLDGITTLQKKIGAETDTLDAQFTRNEFDTKIILRQANTVAKTAGFLDALVSAIQTRPDIAAKFDYLASQMTGLRDQQHALVDSLSNQPALNKTLSATIDNLSQVIDAGDRSVTGAGAISASVEGLSVLSADLSRESTRKMDEAGARFAKLDGPMKKMAATTDRSRKLLDSSYIVQTTATPFILAPTTENAARLSMAMRSHEKSVQSLVAVAANLGAVADLAKQTGITIGAMKTTTTDLVNIETERQERFSNAAASINSVWENLTRFAAVQELAAAAEGSNANSVSAAATALGVVVAALAGIGLILTFRGPIRDITNAMRRLADGSLETEITGVSRADELGEMARALGIFKQNALQKAAIEQQSEDQRVQAEEDRRHNDLQRSQVEQQIAFAVDALAKGMERLSKGDISQTIDTPLYGRLEQLRLDFNDSVARLNSTMMQIHANTNSIQLNLRDLSDSADQLAKRTEQQAASLEETAAAVEQVTTAVKSASQKAQEANSVVIEAEGSADASSRTVEAAVSAMARIEDASGTIAQIIGVIDEIAFQTNLLALNAGIEAARAGDAGKGFAVVAHEVRELAQRSAEAATQIKKLIDTSSREVSSGAQLVHKTGQVMSQISQKVHLASKLVEMIAMASREQSAGLDNINASVANMDKMTQRNAAMVEETTAATTQLAGEADDLMSLVAQFKLQAASKAPPGNLRMAAA
ncbi:HAMP domain-containing methyl-accepting chemotaxis protein [Rhizobium sp. Leaf386]|uniref:methyl-accepting chemotaxis protein n=1 Tax=Rhizobium sp. Leaf386 TaxID=1736359 RepID=UPI0009EB8067|nr:HAMP domain-containing methyl-accepting chemotaxis protein [Rhizobium sp. Leaf386]